MAHELTSRGIAFRRQLALPISYKGLQLDAGYRLDLLVAQRIVVEMKAVEAVLPIHVAQVMTYLKLSNLRLGLLTNFDVRLFKQGVRRLVL